MPLINTSVPNLIQGVSQQPDAVRYDGQCEEQENALSSVVDGLTKRPNTRHVAKLLSEAIAADSFVHFINRDDNEKYVVLYNGTTLKAFNLSDGQEATITGTSDYLSTSTPRTSLKATTVGDTTFLVNTNTDIGVTSTTTPALAEEALIYVKQGDYKKRYEFDIVTDVDGGGDSARISKAVNLLSNNKHQFQAGQITISQAGTGSAVNGSGFSVGDIVEVTLPVAFTPSNSGLSYGLTLYRAPTIKVLTTTDNNGIVTASVEDQGEFKYTTNNTLMPNATTITDMFVVSSNTSAGTPQTISFSYQSEAANTTGVDQNHADTLYIAGQMAGGNATLYQNFGNGTQQASNADWVNFYTHFVTDGSSGSGNNIPQFGNLLVITPRTTNFNSPNAAKTPVTFSISVKDGGGGDNLGLVYKEVPSISDLPLYAKNGFEVKIKGDTELFQDDFYVRFETTGGETYGKGVWVETVAPNIRNNYDSSTLPLELVNTDVNTFSVRPMKFKERVSGDNNTNPFASFVGKKLSNVFLFKNRLGFVANENVILSESGFGAQDSTNQLVFNFNRTTVTTLLDSDPIDVSVASSRVTNLKSAKGFQENLIIFSENGQFVLKGGDILTPKTVSITPITNFDFDESVDPIPLGAYIYFPFNRSGFTGVREFTVNSTTDVYDSVEITEHVPRYVPSNLIDFAGSTNEDMLALVSGDETGSIYLYKYFFSGNKKLLSSWFKFTLDGEIRGIEFIESVLYIVLTKNSQTHLVECPLTSGLTDSTNVEHSTLLDMRKEFTVANGTNTIDLSASYTPDTNTVEVYTKDGLKLNATNSGSTVTLASSVSADTPVFVGIPYTMKYTFSEQLFKARAGQGKSPSPSTKMMIRNGAVNFSKTAFFEVKVTPKFRDTYVNTFVPTVVGSSTLGALDLDTGSFRFPVFTKAEDTKITIENNSALPSNFQSAEFESFTHARSSRYG